MAKRELQFDDGKSKKFWTISLKGTSHTVTYGRIGTNGQTRTKEFATREEAKNSHDKLVAQKVGKGYVDVKKSAKKTPVKKAAVKKAPKVSTAKTAKKTVESAPTSTVAKKTKRAKKKMPKRKPGKIRCIHVTNRSDKRMDRGMFWDPAINRLPTRCPKCEFPDLDALPKYFRLIRNMTMMGAEIAMVGCGNFVVRERVVRILKCVAPKVCSFRSTYYHDTREKTPWTLVVPKELLQTGRVKKSIERCSKCRQPVQANPCWDYDEWLHLDVTDPDYGKKDKPRWKHVMGLLDPINRYGACREAKYDIFKSLQWDGSKTAFGWQHDWQEVDRHRFVSVRLWELLKRMKVKGPIRVTYKDRGLEPLPEELEWVEEKLELLRRQGIPLKPGGTGSEKDDQWFDAYLKKHARKKKTSVNFAAFEKKHGFKLPKSYKDFLSKVGRKTFRDVDGEEGFCAHILGLTKVDCTNFRRGQPRVSDDSKEVDGIMFASTDHGDCFCLDVTPGQKEFAVVHYEHDYERFEQYAPNFASCIRRFAGG